MVWLVLLVGATALLGGIAAMRRGRRSGLPPAYRAGRSADRTPRPHRDVTHYHASGALPRWEP